MITEIKGCDRPQEANMNKIKENRKANKELIGRNVFVNINNGKRFLTINEIEGKNRFSVIVENNRVENCYFCENYKNLIDLIMSFPPKAKITVV